MATIYIYIFFYFFIFFFFPLNGHILKTNSVTPNFYCRKVISRLRHNYVLTLRKFLYSRWIEGGSECTAVRGTVDLAPHFTRLQRSEH